MTYETRSVLAGAYVTERSSTLTHVVEIVGDEEVRVLCRRVKLDSIADHFAQDAAVREGPATCPVCSKRDPRTKGE